MFYTTWRYAVWLTMNLRVFVVGSRGTLWFVVFFFFSSRRRHTRFDCDWSSDVCSSDLSWKVTMPVGVPEPGGAAATVAVKATDWPGFDGFGAEASDVVVPLAWTNWIKIGRASCRERV